MLFLVEGLVKRSHYMSNMTTDKVVRLVEADTEEQASSKFCKHFDDQTREYDMYVYAEVLEISEVIR